jgi:hypothetical protein
VERLNAGLVPATAPFVNVFDPVQFGACLEALIYVGGGSVEVLRLSKPTTD